MTGNASPKPASVSVLGVHHINIQVDDVTAAYVLCEVLGLTEIERPDFPVGGAWFRVAAQELHIAVEEGHVAPERQHFCCAGQRVRTLASEQQIAPSTFAVVPLKRHLPPDEASQVFRVFRRLRRDSRDRIDEDS